MIRLFAYVGNEPERIKCALYPAREALVTDIGENPDGWGLGFFQGGEVLLHRQPKAQPGQVDFYSRLRELRTDVVVGHVREATVGKAQKLENTHPFRFRSWLFAHSGTVASFEAVKGELLESVPDFLRRNIRGNTDSEHLFHLFLAFLHDGGKLEDPNITTDEASAAMRATVAFIERLSHGAGGGKSELNLVATNGRILLAVRHGRPMGLIRTTGIADCPVCREEGRAPDERRIAHDLLRSVLVLSNGELPAGFENLPESSILSINHSIQTQIAPLREPAL
jgi:predicted glutamine amidotransferase